MSEDAAPSPPPDLATVTTDELVAELRNRCDHILLIIPSVKGDLLIYYKGFMTHALGLATYAQRRLYDLIFEAEKTE